MKAFTRILVGIDYSENSQNALREASRIADWNHAELVCLHVLEEGRADGSQVNRQEDEASRARVRLENYVSDTLGSDYDAVCRVQAGRPFAEVIAAIEFTKPDLLVLGSHGLASQDAGHLGPLASRCVRHCPIDVLLVQERQLEPFDSIVACVDFSESSIHAAHRAAEIAVQDGALLELLHVYQTPTDVVMQVGGPGVERQSSDTSEVDRDLRGQLEALSGELRRTYGGAEICVTVEECSATAGGIVRRLEKLNADLLVLGTPARASLKSRVIDTTAERLIYRVPCSALVVKE